ncbi:uncharacterized protein E0L32_009255 [Thyridium curvatum]|uniref:STB6-like N-terminal domain-containing protein n=1 Tax=Thyridium curvatum TaxID=1093900 RepID=A0A507AJD7_9PEZI|nr:uncharacterized protein E0L32_009255 [Thyridium curvatum]TPX09512.1 hypothetical protein E0L32_009255 [Thyridium curvatum]
MSSFPFLPPAMSDVRNLRREDILAARLASQGNLTASPASAGTLLSGGAKEEGSVQTQAVSSEGSSTPRRRHVVFPDPVSLRLLHSYLEEDECVQVVERRQKLQGYELYLVEQWACSRQSPTLVIATYTGDPDHSIVVGVLGIPADENDWSPRLRVYFKAIQQYHARPKDTPLGELMVTNLSSFPSALTVIPVPDGDIRAHRQSFIVNEDLKRLGCSGRSGMSLSEPTAATQAKFSQLYKTSDRVPIEQAVVELIKLCQVALLLFGKLEQEYIDGLLCDRTEAGINDWWTEIGSEYFNIEPTDGILGPTTVAALLGTLMGARNRLSWYGAPVAKDVFDIECTKRGIGYFQKAHKLERTRRLDRQTMLRLHTISAKAAAGEAGWGVQRAVKSTVEGFGGKRGEIVIGMVGGKDKGNIGDIETLDINKFISLAHGERAKWLWHGKARRSVAEHYEKPISDMGNMLFGKEVAASQPSRRTQSLPLGEDVEVKKKEEAAALYSATPTPGSTLSVAESPGDKDALHKAVLKSVAGKVSDARSGFGRFRDNINTGRLRGHNSRPSRDDTPASSYLSPAGSGVMRSDLMLSSPTMVGRAFTWKNKPEEYLAALRKEKEGDAVPGVASTTQSSGTPAAKESRSQSQQLDLSKLADALPEAAESLPPSRAEETRKDFLLTDASVANSVADPNDLQGPHLEADRQADTNLTVLQRRHSVAISTLTFTHPLNESRWPRRMSFSCAEEAVLGWEDILDLEEESPSDATHGGPLALAHHLSRVEAAQSLYERLLGLKQTLGPWVGDKVQCLEALDQDYAAQQEELQQLYYRLAEAYRRVKDSSQEMVAGERAHVTEAVKDVEVLAAKLEYEVNALASKAAEVEDGVRQFEAQVEIVELRAEELKAQLETESWVHWFVRTLTGIGTGPNITRGGPVAAAAAVVGDESRGEDREQPGRDDGARGGAREEEDAHS